MKPAFINSLPKSGTHLTAKCLKLIGYRELNHIGSAHVLAPGLASKLRRIAWFPFRQGFQVGIDTPVEIARGVIHRRLRRGRPGTFFTAHVGYSTALLNAVLSHHIAPIVVYRDPRAVLVSFVHYVARLEEHVLHDEFKALPTERRFETVLEGHAFKKAYLEPLRTRCLALDGWMASDRVLKIRFEDLVGEKGGGSDEAQRQAIDRLCQWLDVPPEKAAGVSEELFGPGRHTFRKGQIASWQSELPAALIQRVEEKLGDILERWSYLDLYKEIEV